MKLPVSVAVAIALLPIAVQAQTTRQAPPPASPPRVAAADVTGSLNGAPASQPTQVPPVATARPAAVPAVSSRTPAAPTPNVTAAPRAEGAPPPPPIVTPAPATRTPAPTTVPAPTTAAPAASAPAPVPATTVLNAAAIAALPFSIELPPGFRIETGRPGPNFSIYTVKRGETSYAMIYAGPSSQFPIYSGEMAEVGGRATVISNQDGIRHAMEHLFQRETAPREIHVWIMSLDGADQALAERIAQTVDVR
ncbi:hypothetical protein [Brevundimonas sp.]